MKNKKKAKYMNLDQVKEWMVKMVKKIKEVDPRDDFGIVWYRNLRSIGITDGRFGFLMQIPFVEELDRHEGDRVRIDEKAFSVGIYKTLPDKHAVPLDAKTHIVDGNPDPKYWKPLCMFGEGDRETEMLLFYMKTHFPIHPNYLRQIPLVGEWQVFHVRANTPDVVLQNALLFENATIHEYRENEGINVVKMWYIVMPMSFDFKPYETPEWVRKLNQ